MFEGAEGKTGGLVLLTSCLKKACCSFTACCPTRADEATAPDGTAVAAMVTGATWACEEGIAALTGMGGLGFGLLDGVVLYNKFSPQQH